MSKTKTAIEFMRKYPNATAHEIAAASGLKVGSAYTLRHKLRTRNALPKSPEQIAAIRRENMAKARAAKKVHRMLVVTGTGNEYEEKNGKWQPLLTTVSDLPVLTDMVNNPPHYKTGGIETIDFIEAKKLSYNLGNVVKYITRADHKGNRKQDLAKALWYLNREISQTA